MLKHNTYFQGGVQSVGFERNGRRHSVGVVDRGEFHFGYVHGVMDCRPATRDGQPAVEWTWDGSDEMDPAQGRGWAAVKGDELHGLIAFHQGDESGFVAKRVVGPGRKKKE